ncbi:condensation domain-containing protein [Streptomyces sp. QH1-20]|uniref:condensation domain-containing protein n=1 Tax=Streptomyces sp. QH1-20 TaxID=3240934 RepID=UPI0035125E82
MAEIVRRRTPFNGQRSATAPATCAQRHMWNLMRRQSTDASFYDVTHWARLPPHASAADVLTALGELLGRYESLRTAFGPGPDGTLTQQVLRSGTFETEIAATGPGEAPRDVLRAWRRRMRQTAFDLATAPLFRAMVVVTDGAPVLAAFHVSHLAADLMSLRHLAAELTRLLDARTTGRPAPPPAAFRQPVEQAEYERSPRGQALLARSRAYWRDQLAAAPATMFPSLAPGTTEPSAPDRYSAVMDSRAASLALPVLAERWRVSTSAVLLTAVATLLGRRAGLPVCTLRLLAANRFAPELRCAVANLHQEVPVTIDLTGDSVPTIARRAFAACTTAYANGLYDPDHAEELLRAAERERGTGINLSCCFNDIRATHETRGGGPPAPAHAVRAALAETVVARHAFAEGEDFFLVVDDEEPGRLRLVLNADTRAFPPPEVHTFLHDVERLLVELIEDAPQQPRMAGRSA